jgi:hypothetical protein
MPRPNIKKLEQEVAAFNRRLSVGDEVDYYETQDDINVTGKSKRYRTRTPAQVLSGHTAVVWLEGKSGCVCCSHCFPPPGVGA